MHLAYVDESGDSHNYVLVAVLVPDDQWKAVHDQLIAFRSRLSKERGFLMRHELHATELMAGGGKWKALGTKMGTRHGIFKAALRELSQLAPAVRVIAVVVDSQSDKLNASPREEAWNKLLERMERFSFFEKSNCILVHDEGSNKSIRTMTRRKRRFGYAPAAFGGPGRKVPFERFLDDAIPRNSRESYFLQWTDLVAYAAFRRIVPWPTAPKDLWDSLGNCPVADANYIERSRGSSEPPGLIIWPSRGFRKP